MNPNMSLKTLIPSRNFRKALSTFIKKDLNYLRVWHKNNANWEVTDRYDIDRIRVNVGRCYILDILLEELRIPVYKDRFSKAFAVQNQDKMTLIDFDIIEKGAYELTCEPAFLKENESEIMKGHRAYLDQVFVTSAKSPYQPSYWPNLVEEINAEFNLKILHPDYFDEADSPIKIGNNQTLAKDDYERIKTILLSKRWIFAKTMPDHLHWYTLRKEWENDEESVYVVNAIRQYGYTESFYNKDYTRLDIEDMKYWTMGAPIEETILINRAFIER